MNTFISPAKKQIVSFLFIGRAYLEPASYPEEWSKASVLPVFPRRRQPKFLSASSALPCGTQKPHAKKEIVLCLLCLV